MPNGREPHPLCSLCGSRGQVSNFLRLLPVEIIVYIFSLCIRQFEPRRYKTKYEAAEVLRLASICHRLRSLVHSTPVLWATAMFFPELEQDYNYISQWLSRAESLPLSIRIDYTQGTPSNPQTDRWILVDEAVQQQAVTRSFKQLSPFLVQCAHLDIKIDTLFPDILPKTPAALQQLQSFTIWTEDAYGWPVRLDDTIAPNLTCARLEGATLLGPTKHTTSLPWGNLVDIELSRVEPAEVLEILHCTPKVETLAVFSVWGEDTDATIRPPVTLPNLKVLDWHGYLSVEITPVFDAIIAPSLSHLRLAFNSYMGNGGPRIEPCLPFIRRVAPTLTLCITSSFRDHSNIFGVWSLSNRITLLHVDAYHFKRKFYFRNFPTPAMYATSLIENPNSEEWKYVTYYLPAMSST